ncbi:MAG: TldD/PmbA family protein [Candidatus Bathyarchaeota archaeon]|nr:MAG: TldD/PmbA family protein [Candidatus Bathyarchaeota archaeon]
MKDVLHSTLEKITQLGASYAEIRAQKNRNTILSVKDGQVESVTLANETGTGIRVLAKGAWGFSTTNSLEQVALEKSLHNAFKMANAAGKSVREPVKLAQVKSVEDKDFIAVKKDPKDIDISVKIDNLLKINKSCFDFDKKIKSVTINYADLFTQQTLATTEGTFIEQLKMFVWNYCWVTGKSNGIMASARDEIGAHGYELYDYEPSEKIAERVSKKVIQQLEAKTPKSGSHPAIIGTNIVGVLAHEALGHICEADLTLSGSALMGKTGEKIASNNVTIYDSALIPEGFGSLKYDDEGVPGQRTQLIENGILVGLMHNRETAAKMNVPPTGNARAQDFRVTPLIRMRNTCFEKGNYSFDELLEDIKFGYYLEAFRGGQANLDGTFTVGVQSAFEIKNGKLGQPVRNVGIAGNTLQTLQQVDACGKDFGLEMGRCGKGQMMFESSGGPPVRVKNILIGGA